MRLALPRTPDGDRLVGPLGFSTTVAPSKGRFLQAAENFLPSVDLTLCRSTTMREMKARGAYMRYLILVCVDPSGEPFDPAQDNIEEWVSSNDKKGSRILGDRLEHVSKAKTVRVRKGQLLVTDGPFAETREWIGGFDLLDCANIDEAIEIASKHPMARFGRIEVRPLWVRGSVNAGSPRG